MAPVTYAVGDIHGRFDLLVGALAAIEAHAAGAPAKLLFLGDYVDRGPGSRQVVERLMALEAEAVCLRGNHEALMVQALSGGGSRAFRHWMSVGGRETLASYGVDEADPEAAVAAVPEAHLRWMESLPLTSGDGHRIYVHAGLMPSTPLEEQSEETLLWIRERFLQADPAAFTEHVVHGHTPVWRRKLAADVPEVLEHRTNLDTGAFQTGVLAVGVFPAERPGGPEAIILVRADADGTVAAETRSPSAFALVEAPPPQRSWTRWLRR